jgi:hypothetical protein
MPKAIIYHLLLVIKTNIIIIVGWNLIQMDLLYKGYRNIQKKIILYCKKVVKLIGYNKNHIWNIILILHKRN